jgi:hypothetical protein
MTTESGNPYKIYLGIGDAAVVHADPVEPEDEEHGARERAAAPHDRVPPPALEARVALSFAAHTQNI